MCIRDRRGRTRRALQGTSVDVLMPQLGETVAEGKIVKWFKSAGDAVKPGDNLFEIETDKTSMEVPATSAGTLSEIRFGVGEVAKVGAVVAVISGAGASPSAAPAAALGEAPAPEITATTAPTLATSPTPNLISLSVPALVAGTSIEVLSVSISNRLSPGFTASPADLNHFTILPSATVSPSCGIRTSTRFSQIPAAYYQLTDTYCVSRNSFMPSCAPSRPRPDCLVPPNGAAGSDTKPRFKPIMPKSSFSETRKPRVRSLV